MSSTPNHPQSPRERVEADPDYVATPRFNHSLEKLLERYPPPDGAPDRVAAAALAMGEEEVQPALDAVLGKLRQHMGVEVADDVEDEPEEGADALEEEHCTGHCRFGD